MSNELVHGTVGTSLTQSEFEAIGLHVCNSQATGDLIYASSATQLTRLGIGATNTVLHVIGGVPVWSATLAGITLTAPTLTGTTTLSSTPVFDLGSGSVTFTTTGSAYGIVVQGSNSAHGPTMTLSSTHTTPDVGNIITKIYAYGYDGAGTPAVFFYGALDFRYVNVTDGTESAKLNIQLATGGVEAGTKFTFKDTGVLTFPVSVDSAAVADEVSLGAYEISAGHRALSISSEEVVVVDADETKFSHKVPVRWNGATYNIMLCAT